MRVLENTIAKTSADTNGHEPQERELDDQFIGGADRLFPIRLAEYEDIEAGLDEARDIVLAIGIVFLGAARKLARGRGLKERIFLQVPGPEERGRIRVEKHPARLGGDRQVDARKLARRNPLREARPNAVGIPEALLTSLMSATRTPRAGRPV